MKWIFTGPESTGKTTLTYACHQLWGGELLPEIVRSYEKINPSGFTGEDLIRLAELQTQAEAKAAIENNHLWCDTDWITLLIWAKERFGDFYGSIEQIWQK